jgi:hypothetical protein
MMGTARRLGLDSIAYIDSYDPVQTGTRRGSLEVQLAAPRAFLCRDRRSHDAEG